MAVKLFVVALFSSLCILFPMASANSTDFQYCNKKTNYVVKVRGLDITPYPVKGGKETTFSIAATTDENISGGKLVIDVKYLFLHVHKESHDICEETSCPVSGDFVISHSQALPGITPPGSYTLTMRMLDGSNRELSCITFGFSISLIAESKAVAVDM
ncbi:putative phosphatidylglycerol/phosphatidylinositol transfer protein DDB_G0282179 [Solanum pennellii]|uniref:Phosphatidylglycerol/phosphatidylinositol transfer protein DDB_G0282179 n=1 Tax=Solanum pennellii TaxID=28526 RepID=A0ABM1FDY3_SOLPN|nr:putative phosphatidylglycerol/phosphatidylinositol transfer protein DDB_G0282179 [Solanum pennellii]